MVSGGASPRGRGRRHRSKRTRRVCLSPLNRGRFSVQEARRSSSESESCRTENSEEAGSTCCGSRCHEKWDQDPSQKSERLCCLRKRNSERHPTSTYVQSCFTEDEARLHLRSGADATPICWSFFRVLMGVSFSLFQSTSTLGGNGR